MNSNRKLFVAAASIVAVLALVGGSTFAVWSDWDTTETNTVGAGFLEISLGSNNQPGGGGPLFDNLRLAPGEQRERAVFVASTDGAGVPNGTLSVEIINYEGDAAPCTINSNSKAAAIAALDDVDCDDLGDGLFADNARLLLSTWEPTAFTSDGLPRCGSNTVFEATKPSAKRVFDGTLASFIGKKTQVPGLIIAPGDAVCLGGFVELPGNVGNEVQGDSGSFNIRVYLDQA
jgi:predicted ribosomally synthesized peptide with SipW-like signal peptide